MRAIRTLLAAAAFASILEGAVDAATVTLVVKDPAGTGFNDPTPVSPVAGNSGTTLGQQRLNSFQAAANAWGAKLQSNVTIQVGVQMSALTCNPTSGILGQAAPNSGYRDFSGAPRAGTWYVSALANSLAGSDLDPANVDIDATFNSTLDLGSASCLAGEKWWYGIGSPAQGNTVDFYGTVLHEIGHGLGVLTFVNIATGQKANGFDDAFMVNLEDHSLSQTWPNLNDSQRAASALDTGDLHWIGSNVTSRSAGLLTAGVNTQGHVRMFAPNPIQPGSSVSHWDTVLTPNELMEPIANPDMKDLITTYALQDTGWQLLGGGGGNPVFSSARTTSTVPPSGSCDPIPPSVTVFSPSDPQVYLYFVEQNAPVGEQIDVVWSDPSNQVYKTSAFNPVPSAGNYCFKANMLISGNPPASRPGLWRVQVYTKRITNVPMVDLTFTITGSGGGGLPLCQQSNCKASLKGGRFTVVWSWRNQFDTTHAQDGPLLYKQITDSIAAFYVDPNNPQKLEFFARVLTKEDGTNNGYAWVTLLPFVNIFEFRILVTDTKSGKSKEYTNPANNSFQVEDRTYFPD